MSDPKEAKFLAALIPRRRPQTLYHYTSGSGLIGILETKSIWITNNRFLNDSTEYKFALELAQSVAQYRLDKARNTFDIGLYRVLQERLKTDVRGEVYVSSFTENGDQLSQWRAYSPTVGGYSIGFLSKAIFPPGDGLRPGSFLLRCVYGSDSQYDLVQKLFDTVAEFAEENVHARMEHDRVFREAFKLLGRLLPLVAPALKHSSFREEHEWRLVRLPGSFESDEMYFRDGKSMLIPCHRHAFPTKQVPINELVVGPTPHPELACEAAQSLLSSHGLGSARVRLSSIPYRSW